MIYKGIKYHSTLNGVIVVQNTKNSAKEITIPPTFNGQPVIAIGDMAFYDNAELEKITLPNTIQKIGDFAFCDCKNLKTVVIQNMEAVTVGEGAFYNCLALESLDFLVALTKPSTFSGCVNLKSVMVCESIPKDTFRYCQCLKKIHWYGCKDNIFAETNDTFEQCINLQTLYLYFDLVKFSENDLVKLKDTTIYCEETSNVANLAYEGYKVVFTDYNLPF